MWGCSFYSIATHSQAQNSPVPKQLGTDSAVMVWLKDLYEPGISVEGDSIKINDEARRLINDKSYRNEMYPAVYTWEAALTYIKKQELKKAFWFLINLYDVNDKNKDLIVKSLTVYDKIFKMDKILPSVFYTYSLTDPEIGSVEGGHSEVTAPHILERKLNAMKAIMFYLEQNRKLTK